jgi:solute carrier family 25 (mitochondrial phosphate transporter), member 3
VMDNSVAVSPNSYSVTDHCSTSSISSPGSIKFGVYEVLKPVCTQGLSRVAALSVYLAFVQSKVFAFAVSAAVSGVAASIMLCPMEALRIRMVANPEEKKGWLPVGYQMLKEEGIVSMFKGMVPMLYKQVPYTVTKNVSFDFITKFGYTALLWSGSATGSTAKLFVPLAAAALTSILSCITSQPGDMVLSLVNAHSGDRRRTRDIVRDILLSDRGIGGFFVGLKTRFLHVGVTVTLQLLIYDFIKRLCGIAATGMH